MPRYVWGLSGESRNPRQRIAHPLNYLVPVCVILAVTRFDKTTQQNCNDGTCEIGPHMRQVFQVLRERVGLVEDTDDATHDDDERDHSTCKSDQQGKDFFIVHGYGSRTLMNTVAWFLTLRERRMT